VRRVFLCLAAFSVSLGANCETVPSSDKRRVVCPMQIKHEGLEVKSLPRKFSIYLDPEPYDDTEVEFAQDAKRFRLAPADGSKAVTSSNSVWIIPANGRLDLVIDEGTAGNPGLVYLQGTTIHPGKGSNCAAATIQWPIDTGLHELARLHVGGPGFGCSSGCTNDEGADARALDPNLVTSIKLSLHDLNGKPFLPSAPITYELESSSAALSNDDGAHWTRPTEARPSTGPILLTVRPETGGQASFLVSPLWVRDGYLNVRVNVSNSETAMEAKIAFKTAPPRWVGFLLCVLGGLLFSIIDSLVSAKGNVKHFLVLFFERYGSKPIFAMCAATFAYVVKDVSIAGLTLSAETTSGYMLLGFVGATIGLEAIFKRIQGAAPATNTH
jgi:hypothetical protein